VKKLRILLADDHSLVRQELEIIRLLAEGKSNKEIAALFGISVRTVETHRSRIMVKLGLHSRLSLFTMLWSTELSQHQTTERSK